MTGRLLMAAGVLVIATIWSVSASAQACCAASQADGPSRLSAGQVATVGVAATGQRYSSNFSGTSHRRLDNPGHEFRQSLFGGLRIGDDWQVGASVPVVQNHRQNAEHTEWGAGLGDISARGRYEINPTGLAFDGPGIGVVAAATVPTGRSPQTSMERNETALQADVTGSESMRFETGLQLEWAWHNWFVAADAGLWQALPYTDHRDDRVLPGTGTRARVSTGRTVDVSWLWNNNLNLAAGLSTSHQTNRRIDGVSIDDTAERMTTVSAQVGGYPTKSLHLMVSATYDVPVDYAGANRMAGPGIGVTARWVLRDH